jgi:hypothetical protein
MKFKVNLFLTALISLVFYNWPIKLMAQIPSESNWGFTNLGNSVNLGTNVPIVQTVGNVINILLGFLGVLAVVAIVIGGLKVMTSGGNEEQTAGGKKVMAAGLIGLVIIFVAYALAYFIVSQLANATAAKW